MILFYMYVTGIGTFTCMRAGHGCDRCSSARARPYPFVPLLPSTTHPSWPGRPLAIAEVKGQAQGRGLRLRARCARAAQARPTCMSLFACEPSRCSWPSVHRVTRWILRMATSVALLLLRGPGRVPSGSARPHACVRACTLHSASRQLEFGPI